MRPLICVTCESCNQSIEFSEESSDSGITCPTCGKRFVGASFPSDSPTSDFNPRLSEDKSGAETSVWGNSRSRVAPSSIGRFDLLKTLGDGGYGEVFLAYDTKVKREVALKVLKDRRYDERSMARFLREALSAAKLDHPNIVSVFDYGRDDDYCWISYQYIRGKTLAEMRRSGKLDPVVAVQIVLEVALALQHAHRRMITHRDIKPSNIMIDEEGRARLTDFGLARHLDLDSDLTDEGTIIGSVDYMAPEQALGRGYDADQRSDIYSLGIVLFELLAGKLPIDRPTLFPSEKLKAFTIPCSKLRTFDSKLPKQLERICAKATHLDPDERYQSAGEFSKDLRAWLESVRQTPRQISRGAIASLIGSFVLSALAITRLYSGLWTQDAIPLPIASADRGSHEIPTEGGVTTSQTIRPKKEIEFPYVVTTSGRGKVHDIECQHAKKILEKNRKSFRSLEEAEKLGYACCMTCLPGGFNKP